MPPREPLNPLSEQTTRVRLTETATLSSSPPRPLVRLSTTWILSTFPDCSSARTHSMTATATVMACRPAGSLLSAAPTYVPRIISQLASRSPIIGPIIRDCVRRPVAHDSNGRSLTRQLFRVFCRPFPTFLGHGSVPLSGLHYRVLHGIRSQVLCLSRTRPPGSLLAQRQLQI